MTDTKFDGTDLRHVRGLKRLSASPEFGHRLVQ
jgi:hypothetical protein